MQPNWRDEVYLEGGAATGAIEVSSFLYFNTGNKDAFDRKNITSMVNLWENLNKDLLAAENAASNEGKVRQATLRHIVVQDGRMHPVLKFHGC